MTGKMGVDCVWIKVFLISETAPNLSVTRIPKAQIKNSNLSSWIFSLFFPAIYTK